MLRSLLNLFTKKISVFISADSIAVISNTGKFNNNNNNKSSMIFIQQTNQPAWQHAINQLDNLLGDFLLAQQMKPNVQQMKPNAQPMKPKISLQIVLGSDFVRYVALPAQAIRMNLAEKNAYANAAFKEIHGASADDWQVVCNDAAPQQAIIAAAIDKKLLQHLSQLAVTHQLKLKSVKPYLMVAMNGLAKQLAKTTGYLAIIEHGRLTLVMLQQGQCQQVHSYALGDDWQAELKHILMRESVLADVSYRNVLIFAPTNQNAAHQNPAHLNIALTAMDGWHITRIDQASRTSSISRHGINKDSRYAMLEAVI